MEVDRSLRAYLVSEWNMVIRRDYATQLGINYYKGT